MCALQTDYIHIQKEFVVFYVSTLTRPSFHQKLLKLIAYPDKDICPVELVSMYLERTKALRSKQEMSLFLSYKPPYNNVTSTTLA